MAAVMSNGDPSAQPEQIGKYRIVGTLGQGAMGRVYLGEDPHIGRKVAIKVLSGATGEEARARFVEEARTIGHLSHPEIVTLLEFGFHEGQPFLAMEHLEGKSFERWLARRPPEAAVLGVLLALCRAIDHAHAQGVLHRDVKPSNLQVLEDGRAKLLDFGIARAGSVALTATGMLMGTPQYLAPEVLNGEGHSTSSDVYAVGLVAYEALTGGNPFAADTLEQCLTRVLTTTPEPLAVLRPDLEAELAGAVQACLARRPADRPETLETLRRALEARIASGSDALAQPTVRLETGGRPPRGTAADSAVEHTAPGQTSHRKRWLAGVGGAVALLAAAGILTWVLAGPTGPAEIGGTSDSAELGSGSSAPAATDTTGPPSPTGPASEVGPNDGAAATAGPDGSFSPRETEATRPEADAMPQPADDPAEAARGRGATTTGERGPETPRRLDRSSAAASTGTPPPGAETDSRSAGPPASADKAQQAGLAGKGNPSIAEVPVGREDEQDGPGTTRGEPAGTETAPVAPPAAGVQAAGQPGGRGPASESGEAGPETTAKVPGASERTESGETATAPPPTAAAAEETPSAAPAPQLDRLTPSVIRRGGVATLTLEGTTFADGLTVEVRRGGSPVPGIRVRRFALLKDGSIRLTLLVAPDVPLGLYSVVVVSPDGRTSNPRELEISL